MPAVILEAKLAERNHECTGFLPVLLLLRNDGSRISLGRRIKPAVLLWSHA